MKRDGGSAAVRMTELLVRAALPNFLEPEGTQNGCDLARLEDGKPSHRYGMTTC